MSGSKKMISDKVCNMCGVVGYAKEIVTCIRCKKISEHTYCMPVLELVVPERWRCEGCSLTEKVNNGKKKERSTILLDPKDAPTKRRSTLNRKRVTIQTIVHEKQPTTARKHLDSHPSSSGPSMFHGIKRQRISEAGSSLGIKATQQLSLRLTCKTSDNDRTAREQANFLVPREKSSAPRMQPASRSMPAPVTPEHISQRTANTRFPPTISKRPAALHQNKKGTDGAGVQLSPKKPTAETASKKPTAALHQNKKGTDGAGVQLSPKKPTAETASKDSRGNTNNHNSSGSGCGVVAHLLREGDERKGKVIEASAPITEKAADVCTVGQSYPLPPNHIEPMETSCNDHPTVMHAGEAEHIAGSKKPMAHAEEPGFERTEQPLTSLAISNNEQPHPTIPAVHWKGEFEIFDTISHIYYGIQAHVPAPMFFKVYEMVKQFPKILKFKLQQRPMVWPKAFWKDPPSFDDVGLYFFPCEVQSSKEAYAHFAEMAKERDLALQCCFGDVELLIFTPAQLPKNSDMARFVPEVFMWGVFRHLRQKQQNRPARDQIRPHRQSSLDDTYRSQNLYLGSSSKNVMDGGIPAARTERTSQGWDVPPNRTNSAFRSGPSADSVAVDHNRKTEMPSGVSMRTYPFHGTIMCCLLKPFTAACSKKVTLWCQVDYLPLYECSIPLPQTKSRSIEAPQTNCNSEG